MSGAAGLPSAHPAVTFLMVQADQPDLRPSPNPNPNPSPSPALALALALALARTGWLFRVITPNPNPDARPQLHLQRAGGKGIPYIRGVPRGYGGELRRGHETQASTLAPTLTPTVSPCP